MKKSLHQANRDRFSHRMTLLIALSGMCIGLHAPVNAAPLSYSGGTYSEDFNGLPNNVTNASQVLVGKGPFDFTALNKVSGLTGWQLANPTGSSANTEFRSQDGSLSGSSGRGVLSLGTNGSAERALGALATSNQNSVFGLVLQNSSSVTYDSFTLSYTGEQWRRGDVVTPDSLLFAYGKGSDISASLTSSSLLTFTAPITTGANVNLDGNLPVNQVAVSGTISGLNWAPGQTLVLRWSSQDISGADDIIGIDNLSFSAQPVPEPSTLILASLAVLGVILHKRLFS